jgi:putative ABC transport system substrate-binding protein
LIATGSAPTVTHRDLIVGAAARYNLPAIYYESSYPHSGGLISYGLDFLDQYRRVAVYVDRILKGEKPADLPVQLPTKYLLAINLKTAKALGLEVPPSLLARADEVIDERREFADLRCGGRVAIRGKGAADGACAPHRHAPATRR